MRTFLIAIMIALLPVRGLVGDAMAMGMALHTVQANVQATGHADAEPASVATAGHADATAAVPMAHGPCPDHASAAPGTDNTAHGNACKVCDVCHQATVADIGRLPAPAVQPGFAPAKSKQAFASADAAGSFKPPIR